MCRFAILSLAFLAACVANAQTSPELAARYGKPEVEAFQVAPGVRLTVLYGHDEAACQLLLEAAPPSIHGRPANEEARSIPADLADRITNELVPPAERKGKALGMLQQMSCHALASEEYANVRISRSTNDCVPPGESRIKSVSISWKRAGCP